MGIRLLLQKMELEQIMEGLRINEKYIRSLIWGDEEPDDKMLAIKIIFEKGKHHLFVPEKVMEWAAFGKNLDENFLQYLIDKRSDLDRVVSNIYNQCQIRSKDDWITFKEISKFMYDLCFDNRSHEFYVYTLLCPNFVEDLPKFGKQSFQIYVENKKHPWNNIIKNHICTTCLVDKFICLTMAYARPDNLSQMITVLKLLRMNYIFDPIKNEHHKKIYDLIEKNVKEDKTDSVTTPGCCSVAECGRHCLQTTTVDYKRCLRLIENLM